MADISPIITMITLNVNGLIVSSKRRFSDWIKKKHVFWIQFCAVYMRHRLDLKIQGGEKRKRKDQDMPCKQQS